MSCNDCTNAIDQLEAGFSKIERSMPAWDVGSYYWFVEDDNTVCGELKCVGFQGQEQVLVLEDRRFIYRVWPSAVIGVRAPSFKWLRGITRQWSAAEITSFAFWAVVAAVAYLLT